MLHTSSEQKKTSDWMIVDFINVEGHVGQEVHHPFGVRTLLANIL
jgi:hypothetical protein